MDMCRSLVLWTHPGENRSWAVSIEDIRRAGGVSGGRRHAEVHSGRCGGLRFILQDTCGHTHLCYILCYYSVVYITLYWFVYLCVERQETLEWWLRSRRLPCAVALPPWREWEWEWAETWHLCPAHWPTPLAPSGPVARLRTAWRHAVRSL